MFISKKKFEEALEKAQEKGFSEAMKERYHEDQFRSIHERIDRLWEKLDSLEAVVNKPNPVGFEAGERKC